MSDAFSIKHLIIIGTSHRSSSAALRGRIMVDAQAMPSFLAGLRAGGVQQAMVLATSDRVEVVAFHHDHDQILLLVAEALAERAGIDADVLAARLYRLTGAEAVRHCFAVTAALDSLVVGESKVLGQVCDAHRVAQEADTVGAELESLLTAALAVAGRVHAETAVAEGPVSIAAVAVQLAHDLHGNLGRCEGLLIGTGDMGALIAESLRAAGMTRFVVTAPQDTSAEAVAMDLNGHMVSFADLDAAIATADVVLSSLSGRQFVIGVDAAKAALRKRRQRPIFFIDAGIPGDIEPAVGKVENAFLYDLTDLERVALVGRNGREVAARAAWDIITTEVSAFLRQRVEPVAEPVMTALRRHFDAVQAEVLINVSADTAQTVAILLERILATPAAVLQELAAAGEKNRAETEQIERVLRRVFRLRGVNDTLN